MIDVDYVRLMFGERAIRVPAILVMQSAGEVNGERSSSGVVLLIGTPQADDRHAEQWIGELIFIPHRIMQDQANHFAGHGLGGLASEMGPKGWEEAGAALVYERGKPDATSSSASSSRRS